MKKIIDYLLIIGIMILFISGCNTNKDNLINVNFEDQQFHFLTTFSYDSNLDYTFTNKNEEENEYASLTMTSKRLNIILDMQYDEISKEQYKINRDSVSSYANYAKYVINGYDSYTFSTSDDNLYSMVILDNDEKNANPALYMRFSIINDNRQTDLKKIYDSEEFQNFITSIKFKKIG